MIKSYTNGEWKEPGSLCQAVGIYKEDFHKIVSVVGGGGKTTVINAPGMYGKFGWKDSMRGLNNDAYTKNKCGIFSGRTIDENVPEEAVGLRSCVDGA